MIAKLLDILSERDETTTATGTYADGVFHLNRDIEHLRTAEQRLRASYARDFRAAHRIADNVAVFA